MASEAIRIGVSGLGRVGWPFHCAQIAKHPEFEFVAVQDPEHGRREEARRTYGVRAYESFTDMLAESRLDAVAIATPTHFHRAMAAEALRAGCHVMLEKPMAPDAGDAAEIVREAVRQGLVLTVYQPRRAEAWFQHVRKLIGSGTIGTLYHARVGMFQFTIRNDWQALRRYGGGMLNNYGAHGLDQLLQLVGYDVKKLFCSLRIVASVGDAEDVVKVVIETRGGAIGELDINQASAANPYFFDAWGSRGTLSITPDDTKRIAVRHVDADEVPKTELVSALASADRRYPATDMRFRYELVPVDASLQVDVYADFARAIRTGQPPFVRPEEPLAVMKLIDRCRAEAGRIIPTPLVERGRVARPARRPPAAKGKSGRKAARPGTGRAHRRARS